MSTIRTALPIEDTPGFSDAFARVVSDAHGKVCSTCGLERMGHASESEWLGYEPHPWDGIPATRAMLEAASGLTSRAYRNRRMLESGEVCGHFFASPACKRGECAHTEGHCPQCK